MTPTRLPPSATWSNLGRPLALLLPAGVARLKVGEASTVWALVPRRWLWSALRACVATGSRSGAASRAGRRHRGRERFLQHL